MTNHWQALNYIFLKVVWKGLLWSAGLCIVGAVLVWGWQVYRLAQTGDMPNVSTLDLMVRLGYELSGTRTDEPSWLIAPNSWFGIHRLLNSLNAGVGLLICAGAFGFLALGASGEYFTATMEHDKTTGQRGADREERRRKELGY
jgi:hypothetical protein